VEGSSFALVGHRKSGRTRGRRYLHPLLKNDARLFSFHDTKTTTMNKTDNHPKTIHGRHAKDGVVHSRSVSDEEPANQP
jgi:hypothetical protein